MPFVSVKCTSCGGEIQLDDQRETGFCAYCGTKIIFKEAVQKMEFSGSVMVDGIATLDKLLQNAETFHKLGDVKKELTLLKQITNDYPEDYRAWLKLARFPIDNIGDHNAGFVFDGGKSDNVLRFLKRIKDELDEYGEIKVFGECYRPGPVYRVLESDMTAEAFWILNFFRSDYIKYSLKVVPKNELIEIKQELMELCEIYLQFLQEERNAIIKSNGYFNEAIILRKKAFATYEKTKLSRQTFFKKKKRWDLAFEEDKDILSKCIDNELQHSTMDRKMFNNYWMSLYDGYLKPMHFSNCDISPEGQVFYCSNSFWTFDEGSKKNEENTRQILNIMKNFE